MKTVFLIVLSILIVLSAGSADAGQGKKGAYLSVFLGACLPDDTDVTTEEYTYPEPMETYHDRIESNPGVYVGGTAGYDFGLIRVEGELAYRYNEMDRIVDRDSNRSYGSVDGDIGVFTFMVNGFIDLHNDSPITPYIGGGIGGATIYLSDTKGTDSLGIRRTLYSEDNESVFAYQVGGGFDIALNRQMSIDIGYRYFATEKATLDSDWYQSKELELKSHNVLVGARFNF